jgi:signal transduction histidine kinase
MKFSAPVSPLARAANALLPGLVAGALYWLGAQIGFAFSGKGILTPVWPSAAVAAAVAILFGPRHLWLVVSYIAADFIFFNPAMAPWAWIEPLGVLLAATSTAYCARRVRFEPAIPDLRAALLLPALGALYAAVNAFSISVGYCGLLQRGHCLKVGAPSYFAESFIGDFFGALVCLPALLVWGLRLQERRKGHQPAPLDAREAHVRFVILAGLCLAAGWYGMETLRLPVDLVGYLVLPLLVWAALQFGALFLYSAIMLIALAAISLQFAAGGVSFKDPTQQLWSLLLFLLTLSGVSLIVHVVARQQQRRAGDAATQAERARIDLMLQSASEAVLGVGSDGRIEYCNPAALRLFGPAARLGCLARELLPDMVFDLPAETGHADALFSAPPLELSVRDAMGVARAVEASVTAVGNGLERQTTIFIHDVTHRVRAENQIREALAREEELNKLRTQFVSMTSHEFRTPLATILSSTELLLHYGERLPASERKDLLVGVTRAVDRMTRMIDRVLFIGKTDAQLLEFAPRELDLVPLCREVIEEVRAEWPELPVTIEAELPAACLGRFDEKLLRHAIGNLLSNAVKYSRPEAGPVKLVLAQGAGEIRIAVSDHGIGIPAVDLPRLFGEFHRASNVGNRPGTGLGLAIVKRSVELHGAQLEVDSTEGVGTTFRVTLPVTSASQAAG